MIRGDSVVENVDVRYARGSVVDHKLNACLQSTRTVFNRSLACIAH